MQPTIFECESPDAKILREEIFGPVVGIYVYPDNDYKKMASTAGDLYTWLKQGARLTF